MKSFSFILFFMYVVVTDLNVLNAQSSDQNYIVKKNYKVESNDVSYDHNNTTDKIIEVEYYDGFGRPIQKIVKGANPQGGDLIYHSEYDTYGRVEVEYLPYANLNLDVSLPEFQTYAQQKQMEFYSSIENPAYFNPNNVVDSDFPWSKRRFEASPINRVLEQGSPGNDWQLGEHTVSNSFVFNDVNEVRKFIISENEDLTYPINTFYPKSSITIHITSDEDGLITKEYKDALGRTIIKESEFYDCNLLATVAAKTRFVYDDMNNLRFVISPEGMKEIENNFDPNNLGEVAYLSSIINDFGYRYVYDGRKRVIEKELPGAEPIFYVYDPMDRLILSQDGNQRVADRWTFFKYDAEGREIMIGECDVPSNPEARPSDQDSPFGLRIKTEHFPAEFFDAYTNFYESKQFSPTLWTYSDFCFPSTLNFENFTTNEVVVKRLSSYDDYSFNLFNEFANQGSMVSLRMLGDALFGAMNTELSFSSQKNLLVDNAVNGLPTISMYLDEGAENWSGNINFSYNLYDEYSRVIFSLTGGTERRLVASVYNYDFMGNVMHTLEYNLDFNSLISGDFSSAHRVLKQYDYDHMNRLMDVYLTFNNDEEVHLVSNEYNAIGELVEKNIHKVNETKFLQSIDYRYNIRGWLKGINE